MNTFSMRALRAIAALAVLAVAGAAAAESADEIIEKNLKAMGGRDALAKVKSVERKGDLNVTGQFGDMAGSTEIKFVVGKKAYQMIDMGAFYQTTAWIGGDDGWKEDGMNGLVDLHGDELSQLKYQSTVSPFLDIKTNGTEVKKLDDEKIERLSMGAAAAPAAPASGGDKKEGDKKEGEKKEGAAAAPKADTVDCCVLELSPKGAGSPIKMCIDKKTGLVFQIHLKRNDPQFGDMSVKVENSDYQEVNGVKLVKNMKLALGEILTMEMIFNDTKINGEIPDKAFAKPTPPEGAGEKKEGAGKEGEKKDAAKPAEKK